MIQIVDEVIIAILFFLNQSKYNNYSIFKLSKYIEKDTSDLRKRIDNNSRKSSNSAFANIK